MTVFSKCKQTAEIFSKNVNKLLRSIQKCKQTAEHDGPLAFSDDKHAKICPDQWLFKKSLSQDSTGSGKTEKNCIFEDAEEVSVSENDQTQNVQNVVGTLFMSGLLFLKIWVLHSKFC